MKEITGNIWDYYDNGNWIVVTTNGSVRKDGLCVMGRGVAKEAAERFPALQRLLGAFIKSNGNTPKFWWDYRIITYPVKHLWFEKADVNLIVEGAKTINFLADVNNITPIYTVRPGCGNGGLYWKDVKLILVKHLDDRFIVVEINENTTAIIESSD